MTPAEAYDRDMERLCQLLCDELLAECYAALERGRLGKTIISGCSCCSFGRGICYGCGRAPCVCLCDSCILIREVRRRIGRKAIVAAAHRQGPRQGMVGA